MTKRCLKCNMTRAEARGKYGCRPNGIFYVYHQWSEKSNADTLTRKSAELA